MKYATAMPTNYGINSIGNLPGNDWKCEDGYMKLNPEVINALYINTTNITLPPLISTETTTGVYTNTSDYAILYYNQPNVKNFKILLEDHSSGVCTEFYAPDYPNGIPLTLKNGSYSVYYAIAAQYYTPSNPSNVLADIDPVNVMYSFSVVSNADLKPELTITSVVNSTLETAEPIRKGEKPRYTFADAEKYQNTPCAEFNFANGMTLREILEEIAGSVNAIPRLKTVNGTKTIYFEELGRNDEVDKQYLGTPISSTHIATVDKYASHLDSVVNGLMNMDNEQQGAISDPMLGGFKTLRSEATRIINIS